MTIKMVWLYVIMRGQARGSVGNVGMRTRHRKPTIADARVTLFHLHLLLPPHRVQSCGEFKIVTSYT